MSLDLLDYKQELVGYDEDIQFFPERVFNYEKV